MRKIYSVMSFCRLLLLYINNFSFFFFFNDTATTEIYTLSLHDALPICMMSQRILVGPRRRPTASRFDVIIRGSSRRSARRSEEHTSELQSHLNLVCRLLLEKKKTHRLKSLAIYYGACLLFYLNVFFFNDTATTEIYTLSLHDALPISVAVRVEAP